MGGIDYSSLGSIAILKRITYELWYEWLVQGSMIIILPAIMSLLYLRKLKLSSLQKLIVYSSGTLLFCSNFMSYTLNAYNPLWPESRQFLFVLPFASIAASYFIQSYIKEPSQFIWFPISCFSALLIMIFSKPGALGMITVYFIFSIASILLLFIYSTKSKYGIFYLVLKLSIIGIPLILVYFYSLLNQNNIHISGTKWIINKLNNDSKINQDKILILAGDETTLGLCQYFLKFQHPKITFSRLDTCVNFWPYDISRKFLITSKTYNDQFTRRSIQSLNQPQKIHLLFEDPMENCLLFEIYDTNILYDLKKYSNPRL
jgi:hypothetical protein